MVIKLYFPERQDDILSRLYLSCNYILNQGPFIFLHWMDMKVLDIEGMNILNDFNDQIE